MRWLGALGLAIGILGCASSDSARAPEVSVLQCGPLESLAPLPESCAAGELDSFSKALSDALPQTAHRVLVRVELDDAARVSAVCVESGPGYASGRVPRAIAERLDAIRAVAPGPACAASKRVDLNRYEAKWEEFHERDQRCTEQTRVTRETQGPTTTVRDRTVPGAYGVYDREYERCMDYQADWVALDAPGSNRPALWAKPEIPNPPGPDAYDTATRCKRLSHVFEKRAACIEADGWERLPPPPR
jgi:hypothetical protein